MKAWIIRIVLIGALTAGGYSAYTAFQSMTAQRQLQVATATVRQGDVIVRSFARGELRPVRSVTLTAPNLFGTVQVTRLAALGSFAREKDLVVEFDDSEVLSRVEEKQLEIDQIEEQIKKAQADLAIRNNQDEVELLRARYSVRRAELEVRRNELISAIDARKNELTLDEARRRLKQLESDIQSRREQAQAELAVLRERRNKANLEMARERARLNQVKLLAPMSGLVAIKQNRSSVTMFGMQLPDIREGDQVQPGTPVADILDLSEMEVLAKVGELDRANLREGQEVSIKLDALADRVFAGQIKSMSGTASSNMFSGDVQKKFDVIFSIDMKQLLSALGAKPDYIARVLATAESNRKKPPMSSFGEGFPGGIMLAIGGGGPGGPGGFGGPVPGAAAGLAAAFGAPGGPGGPRLGAGGGFGAFGGSVLGGLMQGLTEDQQKKLREIFQKALSGKSMRDLSEEDRTALFAQIRRDAEAAGIKLPRPSGHSGPGAGGSIPGGFSAKDLENAKLPPPPEEDSQFDVLLRPGLLADVEIIVEKIPNAIHLPTQAIFEKDGKPIVYLKVGNRFEERVIQPSKRSESTMVIAGGVKPGDIVALADPNARPNDKKRGGPDAKGSGSGAAMPIPKS